MHLRYIHRTRGVAIISIVAIHCVGNLDWSNNFQTFRFMVELFEGSTVIFVMISGFLFQHLSARFNYARYLKTKLKNVIIPWFLVALPGVLLLLSKPHFILQNPELRGTMWWEQFAFLYLYGGSQINHVLWFIPVLIFYFLLAPVFIYFLERPIWFVSLLGLIPFSILAHRPNIQKYHYLQLVAYFLSAYMSGMMAGLYKEKVLAFSDKYKYIMMAAVSAILLSHFILTAYVGSYVDDIFSNKAGMIDWLFVQKFILFFILLAVMRKLENRSLLIIDYIATVSFPIFFLHIYVLHIFNHFAHWHQFPGTIMNVVGLSLMVLVCSAAAAYVSRLAFGPSSRMLVGA